MSKRKKNKDVIESSDENSSDVNLLAEKSLQAAKDFFNEESKIQSLEDVEKEALLATEEAEEIEESEMSEKTEGVEAVEASEVSEESEESEDLFKDNVSDLFADSGLDFIDDKDQDENSLDLNIHGDLEDSELSGFESADIEDVEFIEDERLSSIIESILFATDKPVSMNTFKIVFKGTNVRSERIRRTLNQMSVELAGGLRGVTLEEVPGGYQLRTKIDNMNFITRSVKPRQFKVSGPALEVLAIVAYKQPLIKSEIDEIRGVESGHLLRALMEKGLVSFEGKSDLPGKPMLYATTKKFLEIFGLRNLKELPTLSQIDELLPEGIGDEEVKEKSKLSDLTENLSQNVNTSYSEGEEELNKISDQLVEITTTTEFFEHEKLREKMKKEADKAQSIRESMAFGETVSTRDRNWLSKYDEAMAAGQAESFAKGTFGKAYVELVNNETSASTLAESSNKGSSHKENSQLNADQMNDDNRDENRDENMDEESEEYHSDDDLALEFGDDDGEDSEIEKTE